MWCRTLGRWRAMWPTTSASSTTCRCEGVWGNVGEGVGMVESHYQRIVHNLQVWRGVRECGGGVGRRRATWQTTSA